MDGIKTAVPATGETALPGVQCQQYFEGLLAGREHKSAFFAARVEQIRGVAGCIQGDVYEFPRVKSVTS